MTSLPDMLKWTLQSNNTPSTANSWAPFSCVLFMYSKVVSASLLKYLFQ